MNNPFVVYVDPDKAKQSYKVIKEVVGQDDILFAAMGRIAGRRGIAFETPKLESDIPAKHLEIEDLLSRLANTPKRQGMLFELIEEIQVELGNGPLPHLNRFRESAVINSGQGFNIRLNADGAWMMEWELDINGGGVSGQRVVSTSAYHNSGKQITPSIVLDFLNSAITLFKKGSFGPALALMTIAAEATLRDVLSAYGYESGGKSKPDVYKTSPAHITVDGDYYRVKFPQPMPKTTSEFKAAVKEPMVVNIRRTPRKKEFNLVIDSATKLADYWSSDEIDEPGQQFVEGLGTALILARGKGIISPTDLPIDFDDVLKAVRNNLVHLSSASLEIDLSELSPAGSAEALTLRDLVNRPEVVLDFMTEIPQFVNEQYGRLWKAELVGKATPAGST